MKFWLEVVARSPLFAVSVRYLRCPSATRGVRPLPAVSVRYLRCPSVVARSGGQKWWPEVLRTESQDGRPGMFSRAPRESPAHRESVSFTGRLVPETCMAPCMAPCIAPCTAPCIAPCIAPCMALVCPWIKSVTPQMINQPRRSFSGVGGGAPVSLEGQGRALPCGPVVPRRPKDTRAAPCSAPWRRGRTTPTRTSARHREPARSPPRPHPHTQTFAHPPLKPPPTKPRIRTNQGNPLGVKGGPTEACPALPKN